MAKHFLTVWLCVGGLVAGCSGSKPSEDMHEGVSTAPAAGSSTAGARAQAGSSAGSVAARGGSGGSTAAASGGAHATGDVQVAGSGGMSGQAPSAGAGAAAMGGAPANTGSAGQVGQVGQVGQAGAAGHGAAGSGAPSSCDSPPQIGELIGWAAVSGMGVDKTTGGGNSPPIMVASLAELTAAVSGDLPAVVHVKGKLSSGSLRIGSNKTIVGLCGAELHGHVSIDGASNIIMSNLTVIGYGLGDCSRDPKYNPAVGCSSGDDAITVQRSHHLWFDHCDVSDGTDGNLDITNGADFVTVSWTRFHYTERTDPVGNDSTGGAGHRFSNLIGGADNVPGDVGHLNVTWHHNWWADHVMERMPRTRAGKIHVLNNLFTSSGNNYCTNAGAGASLLVEGNAYLGVKNPLQPTMSGDMRAQDNVFTGSSGTTSVSGMGFMPPYKYTAEPSSGVEAAVRAGAGPH